MAEQEDEWDCVLSFDTDDPEFTRGFEMGMLYERLSRDGWAHQLLHAENAEMMMRVAESMKLVFAATEVSEGWLEIRIGEEPA